MPLHGLDANLLVYMQALLREGNVARAARRVGLSQSGMSRAVTRLRSHFEDPLFVATGRGLRATPFAMSLLEPLSDALGSLERVGELRASFDPGRSRRTFRIVSADYSTLLLLAPLQAIFAEQAPGIALDVTAMGQLSSDMVERGDVDLVIGPPARERPTTVSKLLYTEDFCIVARPKHRILSGKASLEAYARASHVLVAPGGRPGSLMDPVLAAARVTRRIAARLPSFLSVPAFLLESDHIATLPRHLARVFVESWGLGMRDLPVPSPTFPVTISFQSERARDPAQQWLRQMIATVAARYRRPARAHGTSQTRRR